MKRISLISAITLLLTVQSAPLLTHAQVVQTNADYHPFYLDAVKYDSTTGVIASNPDYDATDKLVIKNDSISLSSLSYHYIHFWDDAGTYLGHYATSGAKECVNACIGTISTSDIPLPLGAYSYAFERFDLDDADYEVQTGTTISELFEDSTNYYEDNTIAIDELENNTLTQLYTSINLANTHDINDLYWKTNGTISSLNNYYYSTGKNLLPNEWEQGAYNVSGVKTASNFRIRLANLIKVKPSTTYTFRIESPYSIAVRGYDINGVFVRSIGSPSSFVLLSNEHYVSITVYYDDIQLITPSMVDTIKPQLEQGSTATAYEAFIPPTISINLTDLGLSSLTKTQIDNYYFNFYEYNGTSTFGFTPGVFSYITEDWYANDTEEWVYNLTEIFGSSNEPDTSTMATYYSDYLELDDYSYISSLAWAVAPTYSVVYWDDQVDDAISGGFMILVSAGVTFVLMLIGFKTRAKLFNLLAMASSVWFTIQAGATLPIILVGFGLIIMNALFFAKEGN